MSEDALVKLADQMMAETVTPISNEGFIGMLHSASEWLVHVVHALGYPGIFIMSFLESTFIPIPSEVTMIPAGYLVQQGEMNLAAVLIISTLGAIGGSLANYFIAYYYGRRFLHAYGKYLFFSHEKMDKLDRFFSRHGEVSTFAGRLIPGLRHFISFPAGLAHMDLKKFCIYTGLGSAIWMTTLTMVGYFIGGNKHLIRTYTPYISLACVALVVMLLVGYAWSHRKVKKGEKNE